MGYYTQRLYIPELKNDIGGKKKIYTHFRLAYRFFVDFLLDSEEKIYFERSFFFQKLFRPFVFFFLFIFFLFYFFDDRYTLYNYIDSPFLGVATYRKINCLLSRLFNNRVFFSSFLRLSEFGADP